MPAASTHVEFARDLLNHDVDLSDSVHNRNMYFLGSQGPDMLFFSRMMALPGSYSKYGHLMHEKKCREQIAYFEQYSRRDADLRDYFRGFLTHYALDSVVHPVIFYAAKKAHEERGVNEGAEHVTIEAELDTVILKRQHKGYDVYKDIAVSNADAAKLGRMYRLMFLDVYRLSLSEKELKQSAHDIALGTKLLYPEKPGYRAAYALESLLKAPHAVTGMMLVDKKEPVILNKDHRPYVNHGIPSGIDTRSFDDLYADAYALAEKLLHHYNPDDIRNNFCGEPLDD